MAVDVVVEPRHSHLTLVGARLRINPNHPSLYEPPAMFDQDDPEVAAVDRCVLLTQIEAAHMATMLRLCRGHLPSPKACDQAIELLTGKKR
jgi:hypothetical protein